MIGMDKSVIGIWLEAKFGLVINTIYHLVSTIKMIINYE